jgi:hypothetical protein
MFIKEMPPVLHTIAYCQKKVKWSFLYLTVVCQRRKYKDMKSVPYLFQGDTPVPAYRNWREL